MTGDNRWKKKGLKAKPIETKYKGTKFRSRLEAKWAVFFEGLDISWEYEPEGFEFESNDQIIRYLPDFYLRDSEIWIEIKPIVESIGTSPEHFVFGLPEEYGRFQKAFYVVKGAPTVDFEQYDNNHFIVDCADYMAFPGWMGDVQYYFCECPWCGLIGIQFEGRAARLSCNCVERNEVLPNGNSSFHPDKVVNVMTNRLRNAYKKAMYARFEHGENP